MKLAMTADAVGGVWTYALDLARGLRVHGIEATLLVNGPAPEAPPDDVAVLATGLPLDWMAQRPQDVTTTGRELARLTAGFGADVVQLNSPAYAADAGFEAPVVGVHHSCTATWWRAVRGAERWPDDFDWRFDLARRGLAACDRVVVPSRAFASAVQAAYALAAPPPAVWNGRAAPAVADAGRGDGGPYVFTVGRLWDESKGMGVLDLAAAGLSAPVLAAGPLAPPGGGEMSFRNVQTLGVLNGSELQARLAGATVFVSPSVYEPFGLAVLEAAQAGRPLVLADIPTFRELWDDAAVFTPPDEARALADTLEALLADASLRRALGRAARVRAARYTVEAMAAGMAEVFRSLGSVR